TNLLEPLCIRHLRFELVKHRFVFSKTNLRQRSQVTRRTSPNKLPRYQVSFALQQIRRQFRRLQRRKHLRRARDLIQQLTIAWRRISDTITSTHIRRDDPKHRACRSGACVALKERPVPIELRRAIVPFHSHSKLAKRSEEH